MSPYFLMLFGFVLMTLEMILGSSALDFFILGVIFVISGGIGVYFSNILLSYFLIGLFSVVFLIIGRPLLLKKLSHKTISSNSDALIGKDALIKKWISDEGSGQVEVNNEIWLAKGDGNFQVNDKVHVEKITGNTLFIK